MTNNVRESIIIVRFLRPIRVPVLTPALELFTERSHLARLRRLSSVMGIRILS